MFRSSSIARVLFCVLSVVVAAQTVSGQIGYGVNSAGTLFRFDTDLPSVVTELGPVGFVPEGIDFRPGTSTLYAIDIGPNTTQLYTLSTANGMAAAVGNAFPSSGVNYDLTGNQTFGFDFNPKTLQADNSMRIRLVSTSNVNLRLNSSTGQIAVVDMNLAFANGNSPFVDAAAYINNIPQMGGTTALYDMDSRNNALLLQSPPNDGTVSTVGPFGVTINNTLRGIGFDIYTDPADIDPSISGDFGFAVLKRPDAPVGGPLGAYLLYDVNLATGTITNGALVGPALTPYDFDGGFAVVPEPSGIGAIALCAVVLMSRRRSAR